MHFQKCIQYWPLLPCEAPLPIPDLFAFHYSNLKWMPLSISQMSFDPIVFVFIMSFNCDSNLGYVRPDIPVLVPKEHGNYTLAA